MSLAAESESSFGFEELFFSRTDANGIIESGNSVFQRVSQYDWNEILNRPHNIVRHPAMPKGVFHLLWETIKSGNPIGAYVINRSKNAGYYWVFAIVTPIDEGFLSVRLKPSSPVFEIVKQKYAELLEIEKSKTLSPKDSQDVLLQIIKSLNFKGYNDFMTEALIQELESRQKNLNLEPIRVILQLRDVLQLATELQKMCEIIFSAYHTSKFVPLNLEIHAAKIGQEAAPLAVISAQYDNLAKLIQQEIQKFVEAGKLVQDQVEKCQFNVCNSILQKEMFLFFKNETKPTPIKRDVEMAYLEKLGVLGVESTKFSLRQIDIEFTKFKSILEEVRSLANALEIVSISGKIEAAKIMHSSVELNVLLNDFANFKTVLRGSLKEIDEIGNGLISHTHEMNHELV